MMIDDKIKILFDKKYNNHRFIYHVKLEDSLNSILIMEENGKAFCRVYMFKNDKDSIYLDWLSVNPNYRKQGIGTMLQEIREEIGRILGYKNSCLWVEIDSWMHQWYKRRLYHDWIKNENYLNTIWMIKNL